MLQTIDPGELDAVHGGSMLNNVGQGLGFGAGVAVTGALAFVPGWNQQVPGKPPGFERRHEAVVGPRIASYADRQPAGAWRDFTSGVGAGATAAPGWSFRHGL